MIIVSQTEPYITETRRFQLRCVLEMPIQVQKGQDITGELRLKSHSRQSYDVHLQLTGQDSALLRACPAFTGRASTLARYRCIDCTRTCGIVSECCQVSWRF